MCDPMNAVEHPLTREELIAFTRMQSVVISRMIRERDIYQDQTNGYRDELGSLIKRYGDLPSEPCDRKEDYDEMVVAWYTTEDGWLAEKPPEATADTPVVIGTGLAEMLDKIAIPVEKKK